ncbi:MAG: ferrous iron transport protein A [Eubacteriales bacterium]|nr:ferrous iron transport protein A [Eubacteriales bacterium]MDY3332340.1 ferrous iron transport protein A [Gallibacter sp.]
MTTVKELKIGQTAKITKVNGQGAVKRRIMDMGVTKGTTLQIHKVAPLGDPIQIFIRGYELSLRKEDADQIEVQIID